MNFIESQTELAHPPPTQRVRCVRRVRARAGAVVFLSPQAVGGAAPSDACAHPWTWLHASIQVDISCHGGKKHIPLRKQTRLVAIPHGHSLLDPASCPSQPRTTQPAPTAARSLGCYL
jgi:hypothetical protein